MRFVILHQGFTLPDSFGDVRSFEMARRLAHAGHDVTVIAGSPPDQMSAESALNREAPDGNLDIVYVSTQPDKAASKSDSLASRLGFAAKATHAALKVERPDAILAVAPPLSVTVAGYITSRVKAAPLILELRTLWPDVALATEALRNSVGVWFARTLEHMAYRAAHHIVALSPGVKEAVMATGVQEQNISVVTTGSDPEVFRGQSEAAERFLELHSSLVDQPLVAYVGPLNKINDVSFLIKMAAAMRTIEPDVKFVISGEGDDRGNVRALAEHTGTLGENVWLLPPLSTPDRAAALNAATVSLGLVADSPLLQHYTPECVSEALSAGRPVALNQPGWQTTLIESRGAGFAIPQSDPQEAAREIAEYLSDTDGLRRAREQAAALADTRFNIERSAGEFRAVLEEVATRDPAPARRRKRSLFLKRVFDIAAATFGLIVAAPALIAIAITILVKMGRPIFFVQERPGLKGQPFKLIKFRTMAASSTSDGVAPSDAERMTPIGQFLRKTSLDELPELFNVFVGHMSLVGPRPLLVEYLPYYTSEQARRHDVRPGITGLAQVRGRNALTWEDKFALDVEYADNRTFWLDLKILWETIPVVFRGKGVAAEGHATMPRFDEIMARQQGAEDES